MQSFSFLTLNPKVMRVHGSLDFDMRPNGIGVRRLPSWTHPQVPQGMDVMARMPSGVRVQLYTDAAEISLTALTTTFRYEDGSPAKVPFQLEAMDTVTTRFMATGNAIKPNPSATNGFELVRGSSDTITFSDLGDSVKFCEIWLPHHTYVELQALQINDGATLHPLPQDTRKHWVHYGSSISHCMEARVPTETWPAVAARLGKVCLTNFGVGGQCHLDQFMARTIRDQQCDFISMKVGINIINLDSMKERVFTPAVHGFLDTIRERKPTTPILVISPIFCPSAETRAGPTIPDKNGRFQTKESGEKNGSLTLQRVRELLEEIVQVRQASGDTNLQYFDGLELFNEKDRADLPDDLHPNPAGYVRMGERFYTKYLRTVSWNRERIKDENAN